MILTPTLEELGLLNVQEIRDRWTDAVKSAEDLRALNIARNVRAQSVKDELQEAANTVMKKAVEEVTKDIEVYVFVDISASMQGAIEAAKTYVSMFLQGFKLEQLHVATFNTQGRRPYLDCLQANVAHSVEHQSNKLEVAGSNPAFATKTISI